MFARFISFCGILLCAAGAIADGIGINVPLAARLTGAGNVVYSTAIDVSNHAGTDVRVSFYFDAVNARTQNAITITGIVTNDGLRQPGQGLLRGHSSAHFEDFIAALADSELMPEGAIADGVLGSVLFVFDGVTRGGQASVIARFENDFAGGTIGVSLRGREVTAGEPQHLIALVRDSRGNTRGDAELYPNLFINNMGLTPGGEPSSEAVNVEVSAVSSRSGLAVGTPLTLLIRAGQTASVNSALRALQVPGDEESVLVTARVTSGDAAIHGIVSQVDEVTRDGSVFEMSKADF